MAKMPELEVLLSALHRLEQTTKLGEKRELLACACEKVPNFLNMAQTALNPYLRFYLKQLPAPPFTTESTGVTWAMVSKLLDKLSQRKVTGSAAKDAVHDLMMQMNGKEREVLKRVVLKDLRCGVGASLLNQALPDSVPTFGVMLATPLESTHLRKMGKTVFLQAKKNGDRCVVICEPGVPPQALSRKGHPLKNYNTICNSLQELMEHSAYKEEGLVFDGEVINKDFYGTRAVKKLAGNEATDSNYFIFDVIPFSEWVSGKTSVFSTRLKVAKSVCSLMTPEAYPCLHRVKSLAVEAPTWKKLEAYRNHFMEDGDEGLMIRLDLPYNFATRSSLYKFKLMDTMDCRIVEILPGEPGKKHQHHTGSVLVELPTFAFQDKSYTGIQQSAGVKMSDKQRDHVWQHKGRYVGLTCEIAYQEITRNLRGEPNLQFPVMLKFRFDKD